VEKGYSVAYGARNLRRLIQREIEDAVATEMVDNRKGNVSKVFVTVVDGKVTVQSE
jgi:ATP-dependent Clp protease ATP-binding subunit ClpA